VTHIPVEDLKELRAPGLQVALMRQPGRFESTFDVLPEQPVLLTAERDGHVSFVPFNRPALDLSDLQVDGRPNHPVDVFVYGPRDLYRPGETVDVGVRSTQRVEFRAVGSAQ
jgi:hypothetical protein